MTKKSIEPLDIYDSALKDHVSDLLCAHGPLSFRLLRLFVKESFPVGALMPTLQEMLAENRIEINSDGLWCKSDQTSQS